MNIPMPYQFDRSKPFYPLVVNYFALLWGIKELAGRAVALRIREMTEEQRRADASTLGYAEIERLRTADLRELMFPMALLCRSGEPPIPADTNEFALEFFRSPREIVDHTLLAAGQLVIQAYQGTAHLRQGARHDGALWEFLRHCRNAAAHGGRFHFERDEPRFPAEWRSFQIARAMQGEALFGTQDRQGFLWVGDPIALLWDIEQTIP